MANHSGGLNDRGSPPDNFTTSEHNSSSNFTAQPDKNSIQTLSTFRQIENIFMSWSAAELTANNFIGFIPEDLIGVSKSLFPISARNNDTTQTVALEGGAGRLLIFLLLLLLLHLLNSIFYLDLIPGVHSLQDTASPTSLAFQMETQTDRLTQELVEALVHGFPTATTAGRMLYASPNIEGSAEPHVHLPATYPTGLQVILQLEYNFIQKDAGNYTKFKYDIPYIASHWINMRRGIISETSSTMEDQAEVT
ncbi:hypothetical protein C8R44DRAFT_725365 [Mycena epipterygia]|nr:hypothetical protein C8R44DRAFT_725365 [Mycena epipterygia]